MPITFCRYIKTTGHQCQSPAMRSERFCYYHTALAKRHRYFRPNQVTDPQFVHGRHIRLNPVDDRDSIQMALSQTMGALAAGQIDLKAGVAVLYAIQLTLQNIKELEAHPAAPATTAPVASVVKSADHLDLAPEASEVIILEGQSRRLDRTHPESQPDSR